MVEVTKTILQCMGRIGKSRTHQPPVTQGNFPSIADLRSHVQDYTYPTSDQQHNSYCLHTLQERYTILDPVRLGDRAL